MLTGGSLMASSFSSLLDRSGSYRPVLDRTLLGLALVGVLIVVHLSIQQERGFDRGCLGVPTLDAVESTFDCSAVVNSGGGTFLGLSNIVWGLGFYGTVALLTFGGLLARSSRRRWLTGTRVAVLTGGFAYSVYLVHLQVNVLGKLCALCMASAAVATLLFGIQLAILSFDSSSSSMTARSRKREIVLLSSMVALVVVLAGADLTYFSSLNAPDGALASKAAVTSADDPSRSACRLDAQKGVVDNWQSLVDMQDPMSGTSGAPVTIIEYFDPNCPHCADFHEVMKKLEKKHEETVRIVYKPFPLQAASLPEIMALYVAAQEGKFLPMLEAQYSNQGPISERDLRSIAERIGMSPDVLMSKVGSQSYRDYVLQQRQRAVKIGVDSTPTVLINGHFVASRTEECMTQFVQQAKNGELATAGR